MAKLTVLSLGWGVQSFTLAAMSALGELPRLDYAIHADTTWEREATYQFAERWTPWLKEHGVNVVTVRATNTDVVRHSGKSNGSYTDIPAFTVSRAGSYGRINRQCTSKWKIAPQRKVVNLYFRQRGLKKFHGAIRLRGLVDKWLGISLDEWWRAKHSDEAHVTHQYPLLDLRMTRQDCIRWLHEHNLEVPVKSSCVFCPFHNQRAWSELKRENGSDWQRACAVDAEIRDVRNDEHARKPAQVFVHRSCVPLADAIQLPEDHGYEQQNFVDDDLVSCDSGYCFL